MVKGTVKVIKNDTNIRDYMRIFAGSGGGGGHARAVGTGGDLQKFIDSEVVRLSDPYVPSDTTALRKSVFINTQFGSGKIIYTVYGNPDGRNTWNDETSNFQDRPMRGPYWVKRMLDAGGWEKLKLAIVRWLEKYG